MSVEDSTVEVRVRFSTVAAAVEFFGFRPAKMN